MPRVLNKYKDEIPEDAVYIGRPSKWGNPFAIGGGQTRENVIDMYHIYLLNSPDLLFEAKLQLRGKDLVCFCAPQACHGDILLEWANQ